MRCGLVYPRQEDYYSPGADHSSPARYQPSSQHTPYLERNLLSPMYQNSCVNRSHSCLTHRHRRALLAHDRQHVYTHAPPNLPPHSNVGPYHELNYDPQIPWTRHRRNSQAPRNFQPPNPEVTAISYTAAILRLDWRLAEFDVLCSLLPESSIPKPDRLSTSSEPPPPTTVAAAFEVLGSFRSIPTALRHIRGLRASGRAPLVPGAVEEVASRLVTATKGLKGEMRLVDAEYLEIQHGLEEGRSWAVRAAGRLKREGRREWIIVEIAKTLRKEGGQERGRIGERAEEVNGLKRGVGIKEEGEEVG
ncbi:MAG: hypothetical protein MMC23_004798 [Stictis urceolatum]|nr:hypothetical protein [Stictis urceolata]